MDKNAVLIVGYDVYLLETFGFFQHLAPDDIDGMELEMREFAERANGIVAKGIEAKCAGGIDSVIVVGYKVGDTTGQQSVSQDHIKNVTTAMMGIFGIQPKIWLIAVED